MRPDNGSLAHARGLERAGVLSGGEVETLVKGLEQIKGEIERGEFTWKREREDVHMNIEARLTEICGPVGGKLHTGRSRNDQVATDLRLWARRKADETCAANILLLPGVVFFSIDRRRGAQGGSQSEKRSQGYFNPHDGKHVRA